MSRLILFTVVLIAGCKGKETPSTSGTGGSAPAEPAPKTVAPPPAGSAGSGSAATGSAAPIDPDPVVAAKPAPKDLPPFGGTASAAAKKKASELANLSLGAQAGNNEEDAVATAVAAVKQDPGSALARYAVACAAGDEAFDLAQLTPLTTATACADCVDLVRNLPMADWNECNWSTAVKALAGKVKPSAQRAAAEALLASLADGDPKHAAPYFTAPSVEISLACSTCDGKQPADKTKAPGPKQLEKLVDQVKKAKAEDDVGGIVIYGGLACAANCCAVDVGQLQHNHDFFDKVCFKAGTDQVVRVELISGG